MHPKMSVIKTPFFLSFLFQCWSYSYSFVQVIITPCKHAKGHNEVSPNLPSSWSRHKKSKWFQSCFTWELEHANNNWYFNLIRNCSCTSYSQPKLGFDPCMEYKILFVRLYLLCFNRILAPLSFYHIYQKRKVGFIYLFFFAIPRNGLNLWM
jgi:hypothetical protein